MRVPGQDEQPDYPVIKPDEYRVRVDSFTKHNDKGKYNEDGHDNYRVHLYPEAFADDEDAAMELTDGTPVPDDKYVVLFFDPQHLGIKGTTIARGRQFLSAVVGVPADSPIEFTEFDTWDEVLESFIGRKVIAGITAKGGYNQVVAIRPLPKKRRSNIVEKAQEVFAEDIVPAPDDDLPF